MKQILHNNIMVREYEAEEWSTANPDKIMGHFIMTNVVIALLLFGMTRKML